MPRYVDIFDCFCKDIIGASEAQSVADKDANIFFVNRYNKWAALFEKAPNDILSAEVVKGFIGEILVLKNILIPRLGEVPSMQAWMGPLSAPQDFIFENSWVEVKTISLIARQRAHLIRGAIGFAELRANGYCKIRPFKYRRAGFVGH